MLHSRKMQRRQSQQLRSLKRPIKNWPQSSLPLPKKQQNPKKTYLASKKVVAAAQKKYEAAKKLSAKLSKAALAIKVVEPKGKTTAMSILNNIVLKTKSSLFAHVGVKYDSSLVEFNANLKTVG